MKVSDLLNNAALEYVNFDLPSKGNVYHNKVSSIKIRPTRTTEEKFLRTIARGASDFNEKISKYISLITNCNEIGLDPMDLTVSDQLAILIYSRILSKDTTLYPTELICPECNKPSRKIVNLMDLKMIYLPDDYTEPVDIEIPMHGLTFGTRLLKVKDFISRAEYHRTLQSVKVDLGIPEEDIEGLYASVIEYIKKDGEEVKLVYSDKRELLIQLDSRSFNLIADMQDKYYHGYDLAVDFECPHCFHKDKVVVDLGPDFFFMVTSTTV